MATMSGAVLPGDGTVQHLDVPEPGHGQVLLQTESLLDLRQRHPRDLGIRSSDFEDAAPDDVSRGTMRVAAGVTEELGSEILVISTIDAPRVEHASLAQAAETSADEDEAEAALDGGKALWIARVSKESRVRHEAPLELAVDTR